MIDVHRAADRTTTATGWLTSRHSFSYGPHYDPANVRHGLLVAHNEDVVLPGSGFGPHPHRDMEIVTWVLAGSLVHEDSSGHAGVVHPGLVQRLSTGRGVVHSETNDSWRVDGRTHADPVHYVQMWLLPDDPGLDPDYAKVDLTAELAGGELVTVASGRPEHRGTSALRLRSRGAAFHAARLPTAGRVMLPGAAHVHVFVARGATTLEDFGPLREGDAARLTDEGGRDVTAGPDGAELLVWEMHADVERR